MQRRQHRGRGFQCGFQGRVNLTKDSGLLAIRGACRLRLRARGGTPTARACPGREPRCSTRNPLDTVRRGACRLRVHMLSGPLPARGRREAIRLCE